MTKIREAKRNALHTTQPSVPLFADWQALQTVAAQVEDIVSDAPDMPTPSIVGGLLGFNAQGPQAPPDAPRLSRLGARVAAGPIGYSWGAIGQGVAPLYIDACDALPGVHNLGHNRHERMANLRQKLPELPAYAWLLRQEGYRQAVACLGRGRIGEAFKGDLAEFQLLQVLAPVMAQHQMFVAHSGALRYPTPGQARKALSEAESLQRFFRGNAAISLDPQCDWQASAGIDSAVKELRRLVANYKKTPGLLTDLKMRTMDRLICGLAQRFGDTSTTLIGHLLRLIDYKPDGSNIRARYQSLGLSEQGKPREPIAPAPAEAMNDAGAGLGMWAGLTRAKG